MIAKEQILRLAEEHFKGTDRFITNVNVKPGNLIEILIDGETPVNIKDCVTLSRFIEGNLDREKEDFALDVSSHGAASPLVDKRQYKKHIGKTIELKLEDNTQHEGELVEFSENELTIKYSTRENKTIGKGKVTVEKKETIPFTTIKESKIKLKF
jgi:ribosome maturation factor RimP